MSHGTGGDNRDDGDCSGGGGGGGGNVCFWILQIGSNHKALTCWNLKDIPRTFHVSILPDCLSGNEGLNPYTSPHLLDSY